ncbi:MAG TPA: chromate efflux transporter [Steroidobacteraceae bacterium]|nr:chromate efflux transporter [Steroidobacteraceae bacterium]
MAAESRDTVSPAPPLSFGEALRLWTKIGWLSFGGPAGQIALMHRELVERRRWISETRFLHALNYCMLLPGPEAQQLATYMGWLLHRTWGGIVAGGLFVVPGALVMLVLSWLYVRYSSLGPVAALFFGLKAAVLAVVVDAVLRIGRRALRNRFMVAIAAAAFLAIYFFKVPFPWIVVGAALVGVIARRLVPRNFEQAAASDLHKANDFVVDRMHETGQLAHAQPSARRALKLTVVCLLIWLVPVAVVAAWLGADHVLTREGTIFGQTAVVTFGGAYAVLAYVGQRAVEELHWLHPGEMIDGLAMAETTPGPLIMVLQFVGFVAAYRYGAPLDPWFAAVLGACLTTWVTFVPSFAFIFIGAPYVESLRQHRGLNAALSCVTAAVVGVILNLSVWFATHTLFGRVDARTYGPLHVDVPDWSTLEPMALLLAAGSMIAMLRFKVGMAWTLAASAALGIAFQLVR